VIAVGRKIVEGDGASGWMQKSTSLGKGGWLVGWLGGREGGGNGGVGGFLLQIETGSWAQS
jgi:hypothetical protein